MKCLKKTVSDFRIKDFFRITHMQARMTISEICCGNKKPQNQKFKLTYLLILSRKDNNNKPRNIVFRIPVFLFCGLCFWNQPGNLNKLSGLCSLELPLPPSHQDFLRQRALGIVNELDSADRRGMNAIICQILQFIKSAFKSSLLMVIKANIYLWVFKQGILNTSDVLT